MVVTAQKGRADVLARQTVVSFRSGLLSDEDRVTGVSRCVVRGVKTTQRSAARWLVRRRERASVFFLARGLRRSAIVEFGTIRKKYIENLLHYIPIFVQLDDMYGSNHLSHRSSPLFDVRIVTVSVWPDMGSGFEFQAEPPRGL